MTNNPRGPQVWEEVSEERYDEMLGVLPPAIMTGFGFLVGEPSTHRTCDVTGDVRAAWQPFARVGSKYYGATQCMTIPEFKQLKMSDIVGAT